MINTPNKRIWTLWLYGAATLGCAGLALAQNTPNRANVVPQLTAYKVIASANGEKLASADKIAPGETIEYQVNYANNGGKPARKLEAILPIPASLQYVPNSASPTGAQASLNGKEFSPMPLMHTVKAADGTLKTVPIPVSEYRFLRWNIDNLDAGKTVKVTARAQLAGVGNPTK